MPLRSAILLGATIAQVGEFSFLLAEQALSLGLLDTRGYNLVLGTAVLSIVLTPGSLGAAVRLIERLEHARSSASAAGRGQRRLHAGRAGRGDGTDGHPGRTSTGPRSSCSGAAGSAGS